MCMCVRGRKRGGGDTRCAFQEVKKRGERMVSTVVVSVTERINILLLRLMTWFCCLFPPLIG